MLIKQIKQWGVGPGQNVCALLALCASDEIQWRQDVGGQTTEHSVQGQEISGAGSARDGRQQSASGNMIMGSRKCGLAKLD